MGLLDETGLDDVVKAGCAACGARKLVFRTYVDGVIPFMGGEPVGRVKWVYDGEKFVDGVYEVTCAECQKVVFTAPDVCPRCHAAGGLKTALETPNRFAAPAQCPSCSEEEVNLVAMLPALVTHDGGRAEKARALIEPHDDGFHGYRVDCRDCGPAVAVCSDACPLCEAPGPVRTRPG
ncbi:MAG TPA: hypothetical protein VHU40_14620 [Polyangia bacterium]|jgi:hypothetical protein|nr:hypothetical protein [Polyangia bacterium]